MAWVVAPLLTLITVFIYGIYLYWSEEGRSALVYRKVKRLSDATHVSVRGILGNYEIVELVSFGKQEAARQSVSAVGSAQVAIKDSFIYRFIRFRYNFE